MKWLMMDRLEPSWCLCKMSEDGSSVQIFLYEQTEAARNKGFKNYVSSKVLSLESGITFQL